MKSIFITGGSGKVGFQLVKHFLQKEFLVLTTSRNKSKFLKEKEAHLPMEYKDKLKIIEVDFSKNEALGNILGFIKENGYTIKSIIHNARSLEYLKINEDSTIDEENFAGEFYMDVIFPYSLTMGIIKQQQEELKNVIFISSMYGVVAPTPNLYENFSKSSPIHYGVSKAAQIHLTKELAVRLAPNVRVNCVSFGGIKGRTSEEFLNKYYSLNPMGKMLEEEDVKGPVDFLVSENSSNMTGQNLIVDGGWTIW